MLRFLMGFAVVSIALGALWGAAAIAAEQESATLPDAQFDNSPLRFQRVIVPADRPEDWPRQPDERYLPMPGQEFEKRLAFLRGEAAGNEQLKSARLVQADYRASIVGTDLIGQAEFTLERNEGDNNVAVLDGCSIAIADAKWVTGSANPLENKAVDENNSHGKAIIGNDQFGRLAVVTDQSGKLSCRWSARARRQDVPVERGLDFDLQLPACPRTVVELTLPSDRILVADGGIVSVVEGHKPDREKTVWRVELGGINNPVLHVLKYETDSPADARVRQSLEYVLSSRGLELTANFTLDTSADRLRQVRLRVDSALEVVGASIGGPDLPPANLPSSPQRANADSDSRHKEVVIELPQQLPGAVHELSIRAVAPAEPGTRLPVPLIGIAGGLWEQGSAKLTVKSPLVWGEIELKNCRQTATELTSAGDRTIEVQFFDQHPTINLMLARRKEPVAAVTCTSVALRANEGLGHCQAEFSASEGNSFNLEADISPQWIIDNVESTPPELIADWAQQPSRSGPAKLKIQLTEPIGPDLSLSLSIIGRRRRAPWGDRFHAADLAMLRFRNVDANRQLIHVQAIEPYQLQLSGDENLHRLDPNKLNPGDAALLEGNVSGVLFVNDELARSLLVSLTAKSPQYEADIRSEAIVNDGRLTETYRFAINPKGRDVGRLAVRFSQPHSEPLSWSLEGQQGGAIRARRLAEDPAAPRTDTGDAWELVLPVARSTPFVLVATRRTPFQTETPLALASLIGADAQQGIVEVSSSGDSLPEVRSTRRIKALPVERHRSGQTSTPLAAFRYDPDEDTLLSAEPPLVLAPGGHLQSLNRAWIWQQQLESVYRRATADHVLVCRIEAAAPRRLEFAVPPGAALKGAWIDGRSVLAEIDLLSDVWAVDLPSDSRFATLTLQWTENRSAAHTFDEETAPWPTCNVPVLDRSWSVWLPPGERLVEVKLGEVRGFQVPWTKRLFGPLAAAEPVVYGQAKRSALPDLPPWQSKTGPDSSQSAGSNFASDPLAPNLQSAAPGEWSVYTFSDLGEATCSIQIAAVESLTAWAWAIFILLGAIGWFAGRIPPVSNVVLLGLLTVVALLAPAAVTMLVSAAWLGFAIGRLLVWFWSLVADLGPSVPQSAALQSVGVGVVALFVAIACTFVHAEEAAHPGPTSCPHTQPWQVLIPAESGQRAGGELYYLPESFHGELLRQTANYYLEPPKYLITSANYSAVAPSAGDSFPAGFGDLRAEFEVESLTDHVDMGLPLGTDGSALSPDGAKLDRKPAVLHRVENCGVSVELPGRGRHQLSFQFRPVANGQGFNFAVPVVATARIVSQLIGAGYHVESMRGASGSPGDDANPTDRAHQNSLPLGPADRIAVVPIVSQGAGRLDSNVQFQIEELYWMHIQPNTVTVDARFQIDVAAGRLQHLDLIANPRVRALIEPGDPNVSTRRPIAENPNLLRLEFARPISGKATINVRFALRGASGIGQIHLPTLESRGSKTAHRHWAATVDSNLVAEPNHAAREQIDPQQFLELWGRVDKKPQFAWSESSNLHSIEIAVRPHDVQRTARYRSALLVSQREASVRATASIASTNEPVYAYRVVVPPNLEIERVTAHDDNDEIPLQWTRSRADLLSVFLDSAASDNVELSISGHMPVGPDGKFVAPLIAIEEVTTQASEIAVLREPDTLASIAEVGSFQLLAETDWPVWLNNAQRDGLIPTQDAAAPRAIAILETNGEAQPPAINVAHNAPQLRVIQATAINRVADNWIASADLVIDVEKGLVDSLRLELPSNWIGPFDVLPKMPSAVEQLPGENRRQLVLHPDRPLEKTFRVRISGPLTIAAGQHPSAPTARLLSAADQQQFVLLPRRWEDQQLEWDRRGLAARPLPEALADTVGDGSAYRTYQVVAENSRAQLKSVDRGTVNSQVRLADIEMQWAQSGKAIGVASFDLEPGDAGTCQLAMPTGGELICVELDGAPAQLSPLGPQQWNIALGSNKLPRRLEVIFFAPLNYDRRGRVEVAPPNFVGLPVERTLWHVVAPASAGTGWLQSEKTITALDHDLLRLRSAVSLADAACGALVDEPAGDRVRWYTSWLRRFNEARSSVAGAQSVGTENSRVHAADAELATIDQEQYQLAKRLEINDLQHSDDERGVTAEWLNIAFAVAPPAGSHVFATLHGEGARLSIAYPNGYRDDFLMRLTIAALVLIVAAGAVAAIRKRYIKLAAFSDWPKAVLLAIGLAWWLWMVPGWLGLLLIGLSIYWVSQPFWRWPGAAKARHPLAESGSKRLRDSVIR